MKGKENTMKVFISHSGQRSRAIALALKDWMPLVLHYVDPWVSQKDIAAGDRWAVEVGTKLGDSNFGIICLTPENLNAPWLLFEAGAISKSFDEGAVCPYLFEVEYSEVINPLAQFQAKKADYASTKELLESINKRSSSPVPSNNFEKLFDKFWPDLEKQLSEIPPVSSKTPPVKKQQQDVLEDLVKTVRAMMGRFHESKTSEEALDYLLHSIRNVESKLVIFGETLHSLDSAIQPITKYYTESNKVAAVIDVKDNIGILSKGDRFSIQTNPSKLISSIAASVGMAKNSFLERWIIRDQSTTKKLSEAEIMELPSKYKGEVCFLEIDDDKDDDIPF